MFIYVYSAARTLALVFLAVSAYAHSVPHQSAPRWIDQEFPDLSYSVPSELAKGGYYYLLIDQQTHVEQEAKFYHFAVKILNAEGVQNMSDLSIDYDPGFQSLAVHQVTVHRNGNRLDKLAQQNFRVYERENQMERFLYDGSLTAVLNLEDIREGDVIEYSYTITGYNPVWKGHYYDKIYFNYSIPIHVRHHKVVLPRQHTVNIARYNESPDPAIEEQGKTVTYRWHLTDVEDIPYDANVPAWYDPYQHVIISDFKDWAAVRKKVVKHYQLSEADLQLLKNKTPFLQQQPSVQKKIEAAVDFVQNEVRYLGFESGLNAYKPHAPGKVLQQRFGDCKDKSLLLCGLLKTVGVQAYPVLVSSTEDKPLEDELPTPLSFDHCVVVVDHNGQRFGIDPTMSQQQGPLNQRYYPYQQGLVLDNSSDQLSSLPTVRQQKTRVEEFFSMDSVGGSAKMRIKTSYYGRDADQQRSYFASNSLKSIQKGYLDFYSKLYQDMEVADSIRFTDGEDASGNLTFVVEEAYVVRDFWQTSTENDQLLYSEFYPLTLASMMEVTHSGGRTMPYYLTHPLEYEYRTEILLPEEWGVEDQQTTIEDEYFSYTGEITYSNRKLVINHTYQTRQNHVPVAAVSEFIKKQEQARDDLSYIITYDKSLVGSEPDISWLAIFAFLLTMGVGAWGAYRLYYHYDPVPEVAPLYGKSIGGWLVLVAIVVTLTPFRLAFDIVGTSEFFDARVWNVLSTDSENAALFLVFALEMVCNALFLVFSLLTVVLFYQRRSSAPYFVMGLYVFSFLFPIIDEIAVGWADPSTWDDTSGYSEIGRSIVAAAIWVPYMYLSRRVKQTFVNRVGDQAVEKEVVQDMAI